MKLHAVLFAFLFVTFGCSGGDELEEPVAAKTKADENSELEKKEKTEADTEEGVGPEEQTVDDTEATSVPDAAVAPSTEPTGFEGPKVSKYVSSFALNVRGAPDKDNSTVIRHIKWGDKVDVVINGDWAKIGAGEYVSAKFLADSDPALKNSKKAKKKAK